VRDDHELLLTGRQAGRQHEWLALAIVVGLGLGLLLAAPFADRPLQGTEALLPAYAAVVLIVDVIAACCCWPSSPYTVRWHSWSWRWAT
jgi:hypothetical protein